MGPNDKVLSFIEDYHAFSFWDVTSAEYKNRGKKKSTLQSLAAKHEATVADIEKKIHNLKTSFNRERKKIRQSSGASPKKSTWFAYDYLLFLLPFNESRGSRNTYLEEAIPKSGNNEVEDSSETVNTEDQADTSIKEIEHEDHGQSFRTPRNPPKRARKSEDSPANEAVKCMKSLTQIVSAKDENPAFGEFIANKMKSCNRPRVEISLAQRYINDILFRLDMGLLSGDIQSLYKSDTYPTSITLYSPLPDSPQFSGHPSPIQPCSPVPTISGSPVPPQQSQFSGHPSPIQPCSPVPTVSGSLVPPQQSQSLAGTLNNPFNFLDL